MGDYFALSLKEGRLVFEFDLGESDTYSVLYDGQFDGQ